MEMTDNSARRLGRIVRHMGISQEDGIAILLALEAEENMQLFFTWIESLDRIPSGQECFEKAVEIAGILDEKD